MAEVTYYLENIYESMGAGDERYFSVSTDGNPIPPGSTITDVEFALSVGIKRPSSSYCVEMKRFHILDDSGNVCFGYGKDYNHTTRWEDADSSTIMISHGMTMLTTSADVFTGSSFDLMIELDFESSEVGTVTARYARVYVTYSEPTIEWSNPGVSASISGSNIVVTWNPVDNYSGAGDIEYQIIYGGGSTPFGETIIVQSSSPAIIPYSEYGVKFTILVIACDSDNSDISVESEYVYVTTPSMLPVFYNGTQLSSLVYNGTTITSLYYNGEKIF